MSLFISPTGGPTLGPVPGSEFRNPRPGHLHNGIDLMKLLMMLIAPHRCGVEAPYLSTGLGGFVVPLDHGLIMGDHHKTKHYHMGYKGMTLDEAVIVRKGQILKQGDPFGICGDTGNPKPGAYHDHYEHYINGVAIDPLPWLAEYQSGVGRRLGLLYPGSEGKVVRYLQTLLLYHGFSPGTLDGVWGDRTTEAVKRFQTASHLYADGVVGKATWQKLVPKVG